MEFNLNRPLILASNSPRRQQILKEAGFDLVVKTKPSNEDYPSHLKIEQVAVYLAESKAKALKDEITKEIVIAADTIVCLPARQHDSSSQAGGNDEILGKPRNKSEAFEMLKKLSGSKHEVITGVCLLSRDKEISFYDKTEVWFREIKEAEINYYIENYKPFDKAGGYGIQEWIGLIGIEKINGSYFNVMGLPVHKVYQELKKFAVDN
ncbi:MAG: septum formation protein Maf [Cytophagales bacterium]|nr:septum formation protein Maf [Cytophagales bacterium]